METDFRTDGHDEVLFKLFNSAELFGKEMESFSLS